MELREVLTRCAELWLEHDRTRPKGVKLPLTDREIQQFLEEAQKRDEHEILWQQIDQLLDELRLLYPMRVPKIKSELKWLRKQAHKKGLTWGRRR